MKTILAILLLFCFNYSVGQSFSAEEIEGFAKIVNQQFKGITFGNAITPIVCEAQGNTLIYKFRVHDDLETSLITKNSLIPILKESGMAEFHFRYKINSIFQYYKGNKVVKKIIIIADELYPFNFELGDYVSIQKDPKSKGVNLKLKVPIGWEVKEGDRDLIIKEFTYQDYKYNFGIMDNDTFFSRRQTKEVLSDNKNLNEYTEKMISFLKTPKIISSRLVSIENYPTIEILVMGKMERMGFISEIIMKSWSIFYEDKIIFLAGFGNNLDGFNSLEPLYNSITNSLIISD